MISKTKRLQKLGAELMGEDIKRLAMINIDLGKEEVDQTEA